MSPGQAFRAPGSYIFTPSRYNYRALRAPSSKIFTVSKWRHIRNSMTRLSRENKASRPAAARTRRPAKAAAEKPAARRRKSTGESPYHHGDLHEALLKAAEQVLERDGLPGLTLRAVAREAGVSHAAPTHHFGDLTGLLSELAAIGFRQFGAAMAAAAPSAAPPPHNATPTPTPSFPDSH